jgi:DNA polymerase I-like protein with 3'-5' exonuclease and polymerase domains
LTSDCLITRRLLDFLKQRLRAEDLAYYREFVAPVTPLLVAMTVAGVQADPAFIEGECHRLLGLMGQLSNAHQTKFGQPLNAGDFALRGYIYFQKGGLRCFVPKSRWVKIGGRRLPPLKSETLARLRSQAASGSRHHESLGMIMDYQVLRGLVTKLATLRDKHIDRQTGKIFTVLDDWQASGRVTATKPNLQGVANNVIAGGKRELVSDLMRGVVIKSRNAICSPDGTWLAGFDIDQADIRGWSDRSNNLKETGAQLIDRLQRERIERLRPQIGPYLEQMWRHFRPRNRKPILCPFCAAQLPIRRRLMRQTHLYEACGKSVEVEGSAPHFDPADPSRLLEDFCHGGSDFYTTATSRTLSRPPRNKTERNAMKQTILGLVNAMSAHGLAAKLDVDLADARKYMQLFAQAYPKEMAYIELMHHAAAITGYAESFGGRRRRVTPHYWMVTEPELELFISYRGADKLWVRVVPLQPGRHTLTCWVKSVVDAKYDSPRRGQEIYHHRDGRISQAPYRFFNDSHLVFGLPVRNIPWRIIRRVRTATEECRYQGFDTTRRQLTNHIFQASTADIARLMMLRSQPLCREFRARLVLQIHDELLFEVPGSKRRLMQFVRAATKVLEQPPTADFAVPITVGPKIGKRFGELSELERWEYTSAWHVRVWKHSAKAVRQWFRALRRSP